MSYAQLNITKRNLSELKQHPRNPRQHPDSQKRALAASIERFSYAKGSICVQKDTNLIIAGHAIRDALMEKGFIEADVIELDFNDDDALAFLTADNQYALLAEWNDDQLQANLDRLKELNFKMPDLGFEMPDMNFIDKEETFDVAEAMEEQDELCQKYAVECGKKWSVGRHFIVCGDSNNNSDVNLLLNGGKVDLICTDPEYDLKCEYLKRVLSLWGNRAAILLSGKVAATICCGGEWEYHIDFIWRRRAARSYPTDYMPVMYHANILFIAKKDISLCWKRPSPNFGSVIEIDCNEYESEFGHGKSHKLFYEILKGFDFEFIADPFLGSGASLIACDALGKTCFGMEIKKETVAIALERCAQYGLDIDCI